MLVSVIRMESPSRSSADLPIIYLEAQSPADFPDPAQADEGLLAIGADLDPQRVLLAYQRGIFPWYSEGELPLWWSPDPRAVLLAEDLHVSRSLERRLKRADYRLTWNRCFLRVMRECSLDRPDGTWIHEEMFACYGALHERGVAHSLEVWREERLVGGVYGVQCGAVFAAESKFHRERDMSKLALVALVRSLTQAGIELFDVQFQTSHLASLGVREWPRPRYLERLAALRTRAVSLRELVPHV